MGHQRLAEGQNSIAGYIPRAFTPGLVRIAGGNRHLFCPGPELRRSTTTPAQYCARDLSRHRWRGAARAGHPVQSLRALGRKASRGRRAHRGNSAYPGAGQRCHSKHARGRYLLRSMSAGNCAGSGESWDATNAAIRGARVPPGTAPG